MSNTYEQSFAAALVQAGIDMPTIETVCRIYNESKPSRPDKADQIIADLLAGHPDSVSNATEEELLEAFLDMEAEQDVRDTAQVVLEARKYLRSPRP